MTRPTNAEMPTAEVLRHHNLLRAQDLNENPLVLRWDPRPSVSDPVAYLRRRNEPMPAQRRGLPPVIGLGRFGGLRLG